MFIKPAQLPLQDPQLGELAKLQILNESEQFFGMRDLTFRLANDIIYCDKGPMVSVIQYGDKKIAWSYSVKAVRNRGNVLCMRWRTRQFTF